MLIHFVCPECNENSEIIEYYTSVTLEKPIYNLTDAAVASYGKDRITNAQFNGFKCKLCGGDIKKSNGDRIRSLLELRDHLKEMGMLK